jgi:hypothetical protein
MAYEVGCESISVEASGDLTGKEMLFGTLDANGRLAVTGAGASADGVIACTAGALGHACALDAQPGQFVKVVCGAPVANGALLEADANGKAVTQVAGKILAKALAAGGGDGVIIPALLILER